MRAQPKEIETICLNRLPFHTMEKATYEFCDTGNRPQFEARMDSMADGMIVKLSKFIYGKRALGETEAIVDILPINWWNHLKKDLGWKYKTKRQRVKVNVEQYLLFPKYKDNEETICVTINSESEA